MIAFDCDFSVDRQICACCLEADNRTSLKGIFVPVFNLSCSLNRQVVIEAHGDQRVNLIPIIRRRYELIITFHNQGLVSVGVYSIFNTVTCYSGFKVPACELHKSG